MLFFKKRKTQFSKINADFVKRNATKVTQDDVQKVIHQSEKIRSKLIGNVRFEKFLAEGKIMLSLIRDYWRKEYTSIPWYAITAIVFTLLYVLNPMDLVPDYLPFIGYVDDATVFSFALTLVSKDLSTYKTWKDGDKLPNG